MTITTTLTLTETNNNMDPQAMERLRPETDGMKPPRLVRSSSLDRIKQFPAYLCNTKLIPQLLNTSVQAGIEQVLRLVRGSLLFVSVYVCIFILLVQFSALCFALLSEPMPPGLLFMLASLAVMCGMACKTIGYDASLHRHISRHHAD
ncbi:hypothetical protein C0J52_11395 [Blattella germanica]|nr:hypothetical protein C0J52_11395 [Blattella germanica]